MPNIPYCTNRKPELILGMKVGDFPGSTSTFHTGSSKSRGEVTISIQQQVTKQVFLVVCEDNEEERWILTKLHDLSKIVDVKPSC